MKMIALLLFFISAVSFAQVFKPQDYNIRMNDIAEITATTTSVKVINANARRKYLMIQNKGPEAIYVKFETVHTGLEGIKILSGGNYEPLYAPNNSIWIKTGASTSSVVIYEGSN